MKLLNVQTIEIFDEYIYNQTSGCKFSTLYLQLKNIHRKKNDSTIFITKIFIEWK